MIRDEEELERLAGLQLRDSLVRSLGVSEQLHAVVDTATTASDSDASRALSRSHTHGPRPVSTASVAGTRPGSVFLMHTVYHDSGVGSSFSQSFLPAEHSNPVTSDTTPHHSLPGYTSSHLHKSLGRTPGGTSDTAAAYFARSGYRNGCGLPVQRGTGTGHQYLSRPQQRPPHIEVNPRVFGLSIVSAPARLNSRRFQPHATRPFGATSNIRYMYNI